MSIDVSIVVVHWNVPQLLDGCLRSIAAEVARVELATETIVVDNASSGDGFHTTMKTHPWARSLPLRTNRGFAAGANAGIVAASGDALLILNPDTELLPDALAKLWAALQVAPHVGMVAPLLLNSDGTLQSQGYRFPGLANIAFDFFALHPRLVASPLNGRLPLGDGQTPLATDYALGAAMLVRRAAVARVGAIDESYGMYSEEIDWAQRLCAAGWTTLLAPAARVIHHAGRSTAQRPDAMHEALWLSRARYFARWGTARQRRWLPRLVHLGLALREHNVTRERRAANARIRAAFDDLTRGKQ